MPQRSQVGFGCESSMGAIPESVARYCVIVEIAAVVVEQGQPHFGLRPGRWQAVWRFTGHGHPLCGIGNSDKAADGMSLVRDVQIVWTAVGVLFHLPRRREIKAREVWHIESFSASLATNESL